MSLKPHVDQHDLNPSETKHRQTRSEHVIHVSVQHQIASASHPVASAAALGDVLMCLKYPVLYAILAQLFTQASMTYVR